MLCLQKANQSEFQYQAPSAGLYMWVRAFTEAAPTSHNGMASISARCPRLAGTHQRGACGNVGGPYLELQACNAVDLLACHVPPKVEVHREVRRQECLHDTLAGEQLLRHVCVQLHFSGLMPLPNAAYTLAQCQRATLCMSHLKDSVLPNLTCAHTLKTHASQN